MRVSFVYIKQLHHLENDLKEVRELVSEFQVEDMLSLRVWNRT